MLIAPLERVSGAFYLDNSRLAIIEGPVGSGKTTACCLRLQRHAYEQRPGSDGVSRSRWCIVRNTRLQLIDTTLKTWLQVFPENRYSEFERSAERMRHRWQFTPRGYAHSIDAEFIFRALDDAADVAKLLSLEVSGFWFNEIREIPREILAQAGRRTRYLSGDRQSDWEGIIGDTNPWDTAHYLQEMIVRNKQPDYAHFQQPGGMEPDAENLDNLMQTEETLQLPHGHPDRRARGRIYYQRALQDYTPDEAHVYVHAQRGRTKSGKPIYNNYNDKVHCVEFELVPHLDLYIGLDFGRTPAALIGQRMPNGQWRWRYELCTFDMGLDRFASELKRFLAEKCPDAKMGPVTGDPAGNARDAYEQTAFDLLAAHGIKARPATTNELSVRIAAVTGALGRSCDGQPGMIIHPDCKMLRDACIDQYHYRKLNVVGERYADEPEKNDYSHIAEALQYGLLGGGEERKVFNRHLHRPNRQTTAHNVYT